MKFIARSPIRAHRPLINPLNERAPVRPKTVLSLASLPDGIGFELTKGPEARPITAFICLDLEDICIWMPVSDNGRKCMGKAALSTGEFTRMLEELSKQLVALSSAKSPNRELRIVPSPHHRPRAKGNVNDQTNLPHR